MKIFIVSRYGSSEDLAKKLIEESHDVRMYIRDRSARKISQFQNLVEKPSIETVQVDLLLVEDDASGEFARKARELKRPILGGSLIGDRLVRDPNFYKTLVEGCTLQVAETTTKGIPANVGGWFDGEEFLRPYFLGIRYTRVGAGDIGKHTKGMGLVGQYKQKGNLFGLLRKLETMLKTANYQGFVNLHTYINNESAKISGLDLGLYFPSISPIATLHNSLGSFLLKVATKKARQVAVQPDKVVGGVVWLPNMDEATICPTMVCETGGQVKEAMSQIYKKINKLQNFDAYYRVDIGGNYDSYISRLKEWEWI